MTCHYIGTWDRMTNTDISTVSMDFYALYGLFVKFFS